MSEYETRVFYNKVAYVYNGEPAPGCWQLGWYYEVKERKGSYMISSMRGPYNTPDEASRAMSRDIRSREVSNHLEQLSLEAKEIMLGTRRQHDRFSV